MTNKRNTIAIVLILVLAAVITLAIFLTGNKSPFGNERVDGAKPFKIEFMNDAEKTRLNIQPDTKIQVLQRDASGAVMAHKVIKSDADIINDPAQVPARSPRQK